MLAFAPGTKVPSDFSNCPLVERDGTKKVASTYWEHSTALFVFLRHFGCIACSELISELEPHFLQFHELGLRTVLVGNGAEHFIDGFVERYNLEGKHVEIVTDPTLKAFDTAGMKRSLYAAVGPKSAWAAIKAFGRGHRQSTIEGNGTQQGGILLISSAGEIMYHYANEHIGDHASMTELVHVAMTSRVEQKSDYVL